MDPWGTLALNEYSCEDLMDVKKKPPKSDFFSDSRIITYDAKVIAADIK